MYVYILKSYIMYAFILCCVMFYIMYFFINKQTNKTKKKYMENK